jgi:hypothetical protein
MRTYYYIYICSYTSINVLSKLYIKLIKKYKDGLLK